MITSHCGGTADAPGLEPGAFGRVGANPTSGISNPSRCGGTADAPGSEPGALNGACGCKSHQRQICELCKGVVSSLPAAKATHDKKCLKARPYQRQYFMEHGYWPNNKPLPQLQLQSKSRSFRRAIAAQQTKS